MRGKVVLFVILLVSSISLASNTSYRSGQTYRVAMQDTLPGDLFYGGRTLDIEGIVKGDIIVGAQRVTISGDIEDDVYAWCETVNIGGNIGDGVIGFGRSIIISGKVQGDVITYGGDVLIADGSEIMGDLYVGTGYLRIENAIIHGGVQGGAKNVKLGGQVGKDIELEVGKIKFAPSFSSNGSVTLTMQEMPENLENAPANLEIRIIPIKFFFLKLIFYWFLISAFIIGVILIILFRPLYENIIAYGNEKFLVSLGVGTLFLIVMPIVAILAITVLPLAFILTALYLIILYLSKIFVSFLAGHFFFRKILPNKEINPYLSFLCGLIIVTLLIQIPVLGIIISILTMIVGSGTFVYYIFKLREKHNHIIA